MKFTIALPECEVTLINLFYAETVTHYPQKPPPVLALQAPPVVKVLPVIKEPVVDLPKTIEK